MTTLSPGLIAELACAAQDWDHVEREATALLMEAIGGDTVFFTGQDGLSRHALGVVAPLRPSVQPIWPELRAGAQVVMRAALAEGGAVVDSELLGSALTRVPYYEAMMRPVRGHSTLIGVLIYAEAQVGSVSIGRCQGSSRFTARDRTALASVLPTLALAHAAHRAGQHARDDSRQPREDFRRELGFALTRREREVLDYVRLGYTNRQIGCALGTQARTVRNQLSRVYQKLGVATRAEALAVFYGLGPASRE